MNPKVHQISAETCDHSSGLVVGGVKTMIGEFPHMAALALRESNRSARLLIFRLVFQAFFLVFLMTFLSKKCKLFLRWLADHGKLCSHRSSLQKIRLVSFFKSISLS